MKSILLLAGLFYATAALAADSPDAREITDPKSLVSQSLKDAVPIPIDDPFYTRSVRGGAWSPDGKQIVFATNLTGRYNLWKVTSDGGWPIQLGQSDERQSGATWSPDGKSLGIRYKPKASPSKSSSSRRSATSGMIVDSVKIRYIVSPQTRSFGPIDTSFPVSGSCLHLKGSRSKVFVADQNVMT